MQHECEGGKVHTWFWRGNLRERHYLEDPGLDGRIILKWILRKWDGVNWIDLLHNREIWRALVNALMNLRFP